MIVSRRQFVRAGAMMSLSAIGAFKGASRAFGQNSAPDRGLFRIPAEIQSGQDQQLSAELFSGHLNTRFRIRTSSFSAITLQLIKVNRRQSPSEAESPKTPRLDCFSIVFRGPRNVALESGTYRVDHHQIGSFDIFLTPINDRKKGRLYEAVFNRLAQ